MASLFERSPAIREVVATDGARSRALGDPLRVALLQLLSHRPRSIDEMVTGLAGLGHRKAPTTVRHHVEVLKAAGLIELVRVEEAGGGMLKYYAATARVLDFRLSPEADETLKPLVEAATGKTTEWALDLLRKHDSAIEEVAQGMRPCRHCRTQHFKEYVVIKVLERALVASMEDDRVRRALGAPPPGGKEG
ncbi:MAG: ArsR/SmtB family transcription factor [Methanobacteriota archaeon]